MTHPPMPQNSYGHPSPPAPPSQKAGYSVGKTWGIAALTLVLGLVIGYSSGSASGPASAPASTAEATSVVPVGPARAVTSREWAQIAKSPDAHVGERVIIYGHVTQFDTVTGPSKFRASVDGARREHAYEYDTNTILTAAPSTSLANVVQDDVFRAEVTITGSLSYETTMGGTMTAPQMQVDAIDVIGSAS